jgi:N utilization substance protein B
VLRALYLSESRGITVDEAFQEMADIDRVIRAVPDDEAAGDLKPFALGLDDKQLDFARELAHRIVDTRDAMNDRIRPVLKNWDLERVSRIDRYIMWIAMAEMAFMLDIPVEASINEALELARKYSSEKSPAFINGVLDAVARNMGHLKKEKQRR